MAITAAVSRRAHTWWRDACTSRARCCPVRTYVGELPGVVMPESEESCAAARAVAEGEELGLRVLYLSRLLLFLDHPHKT